MLFTTKQLYGTDDLSELEGEIPFIEIRIEMLENAKTIENAKHMSVRDAYLIKKINDSQSFWAERIKGIRKGLK